MTRRAPWLAVAWTATVLGAQPANAGFRVCNQFERLVSVVFGFVDRQRGWMAQGWYGLKPGECKIVHQGDLDNRYYYLFAHARDNNPMWGGDIPFCIQRDRFLLAQSQYGKDTPDDCHRAGLDYAQFFKVDVNGTKDFTYNLMASRNSGNPGSVPPPPPYQQPAQPSGPPIVTAPPQPPYQQMPQAPPQSYQQQPQPYAPSPAPTPPSYQQPPQAPPPQPYQQQPQRPLANAPPPYQPAPQAPMQQPYQPYQPAPQQQPYQPYQPAPQPQQPYQPAPQPQTYQQAPQQPASPGGGTACQRYPNLC